MVREFDLNIEKILENWEVYHAIREIIANALDEQTITQTSSIKIEQTPDGWWHIIDYGRGLNYYHLTQNENDEKLKNEKCIGRFGIGLKDALATLHRHDIEVKIQPRYGIITLKEEAKTGFKDIVTLHAEITPPENFNMIGTDFGILGCTENDIQMAKSMFYLFSDTSLLEQTKYGDVLEKATANACIYINGVKVAEEPNFLFSYNITSLNAAIKKSLNRERTNVGRTAYTGRIKEILKDCHSENIINMLVEDMLQFKSGNRHDELLWNDIAMYAYEKMAELNPKTTFITATDLEEVPSLVDDMKRNGKDIVVIPENLVDKMEDYNSKTHNGHFVTADQYIKNEQTKFNPTIINIDKLSYRERKVYEKTPQILQFIGGKPINVDSIEIVGKIYDSEYFSETVGLWDSTHRRILIKRKQLKSLKRYSSTLLHECAHALSGFGDVSRGFEEELTNIIGAIIVKTLDD